MDKPTEEQIKEFWEWCGARCIKCSHLISNTIKADMCCCHTFELDLDLNNLFKYAVPKLMHDNVLDKFECHIDSRRDGLGYQWIIGDRYRAKTYRTGEYITDNALALFWAIWQVKPPKEKRPFSVGCGGDS